jgi:hypothetical protein
LQSNQSAGWSKERERGASRERRKPRHSRAVSAPPKSPNFFLYISHFPIFKILSPNVIGIRFPRNLSIYWRKHNPLLAFVVLVPGRNRTQRESQKKTRAGVFLPFSPNKPRTRSKQRPAKKSYSHAQWREERALQWQEAMNLVTVCSKRTYP